MTSPESHLQPGEQYDFSRVVEDFETRTLAPQIPGYERMRENVTNILASVLPIGGSVLDLGCSRGQVFFDLIDQQSLLTEIHRLIGQTEFSGIDSEPGMVVSAMKRRDNSDLYKMYNIYFHIAEIEFYVRKARREGQRYDVVTMVLSLQFIDPDRRQDILCDIYDILKPGGTLIMVEKIAPQHPTTALLLAELHKEHKSSNGMTQQAIINKEQSLDGYLIPLSDIENLNMLSAAGFHGADGFWQDLQFKGYIAIKGGCEY